MAKYIYLLLIFHIICMAFESWAQRSPYSLQTAVDELHRWDVDKFPLNAPPSSQNYFSNGVGAAVDQDYWEDDSKSPVKNNYNYRNRHRLLKALAKYLEHENYDTAQGGMNLSLEPFNNLFENKNRKRTYLNRQHYLNSDNNGPSIFRERELQTSNGNSELAEQFLREIEETQEHERQQRYKNALRHFLEKYKQQDNEADKQYFEEKKRMRVPPYYMLMQKKRSYPVLPWLPYSERKKRFPVTKRSAQHSPNENGNFDKTDERVEKELNELFGVSIADVKQKRSTNDQTKGTTTNAPAISTAMTDMRLELPTKSESNATEAATNITPTETKGKEHTTHANHQHEEHEHEHKHNKRSNHHDDDDRHESEEEDDEESEEHGEHGDEHDDEEEEEDFGDEEDEERKKKRDVSAMKSTSISNGEIMKRKKKSIQWSKYFGIDRKKKASLIEKKFIKRSTTDDSNEDEKRNLNTDKLNNMDKKLQSIEDMIIDETIKYTGAHEGIKNPAEIRRLKDHVLSRLATAYSLEKMRLALEKLRQSVDTENHLIRNVIDHEPCPEDNESTEFPNHLMSKKEKSNAIFNNNKAKALEETVDDDKLNKKHKKKRTNFQRYPELSNDLNDFQSNTEATRYEPLNDMYLGNKNYILGSNQCPIIESMAERCRGVDLLSGDLNQDLLPVCGVHQLCYLCGTSQISCDYQFLAEADEICGNNDACQAAARSILMILRGVPGAQLGPRECGKSACLYSAMREIGL